jgi:hypothetical protein
MSSGHILAICVRVARPRWCRPRWRNCCGYVRLTNGQFTRVAAKQVVLGGVMVCAGVAELIPSGTTQRSI